MYHYLYPGSDLPPYSFYREVRSLKEHGFKSLKHAVYAVGMSCTHTAVSGIQGLYHIHYFFSPDLSDYYPVRSHSQACLDKLGHVYAALALYIGIPAFQPYDIFHLLYLQFSGVLDDYKPFTGRDTL